MRYLLIVVFLSLHSYASAQYRHIISAGGTINRLNETTSPGLLFSYGIPLAERMSLDFTYNWFRTEQEDNFRLIKSGFHLFSPSLHYYPVKGSDIFFLQAGLYGGIVTENQERRVIYNSAPLQVDITFIPENEHYGLFSAYAGAGINLSISERISLKFGFNYTPDIDFLSRHSGKDYFMGFIKCSYGLVRKNGRSDQSKN